MEEALPSSYDWKKPPGTGSLADYLGQLGQFCRWGGSQPEVCTPREMYLSPKTDVRR